MEIAPTMSQEVTRLVLGVNYRVGLNHGDHLETMAVDIGLNSLELLPHFADFLLDGLLTRQIAILRMRYQAEEQVIARLQELEQKALIELNPWGYVATDTLRPLLKALHTARAEVARSLWMRHEVDVSIVTETVKTLLDGISPNYIVGYTHNRVRKPLDRYSLLYQRLVTLRYLRQQDHADAWMDKRLEAEEIALMTALWREEPIEIQDPPLFTLREAGYVLKTDPPRLSAKGKKARQAIEDATNTRTSAWLAELEDESKPRFVEALRTLPD